MLNLATKFTETIIIKHPGLGGMDKNLISISKLYGLLLVLSQIYSPVRFFSSLFVHIKKDIYNYINSAQVRLKKILGDYKRNPPDTETKDSCMCLPHNYLKGRRECNFHASNSRKKRP